MRWYYCYRLLHIAMTSYDFFHLGPDSGLLGKKKRESYRSSRHRTNSPWVREWYYWYLLICSDISLAILPCQSCDVWLCKTLHSNLVNESIHPESESDLPHPSAACGCANHCKSNQIYSTRNYQRAEVAAPCRTLSSWCLVVRVLQVQTKWLPPLDMGGLEGFETWALRSDRNSRAFMALPFHCQ